MANPFANMNDSAQRSELLNSPDTHTLVYEKPVSILHEDPTNPRSEQNKGYELDELQDLANDIKERGLINPLTVTPHPEIKGEFMLISGHRRLRACKLAGIETVPVVIRQTNDIKGDQIAENLHRENLSPMEIANIIDDYKQQGLTTYEIADKLHKSQTFVQMHVRLINAPTYLRQCFEDGVIGDLWALHVLLKSWKADEKMTRELIEELKARPDDVSENPTLRVISKSMAQSILDTVEESKRFERKDELRQLDYPSMVRNPEAVAEKEQKKAERKQNKENESTSTTIENPYFLNDDIEASTEEASDEDDVNDESGYSPFGDNAISDEPQNVEPSFKVKVECNGRHGVLLATPMNSEDRALIHFEDTDEEEEVNMTNQVVRIIGIEY